MGVGGELEAERGQVAGDGKGYRAEEVGGMGWSGDAERSKWWETGGVAGEERRGGERAGGRALLSRRGRVTGRDQGDREREEGDRVGGGEEEQRRRGRRCQIWRPGDGRQEGDPGRNRLQK